MSSDDEGSKQMNENKSMLSGMFSMLKFNKTGTTAASGDSTASGIYLDDINVENLDPEVAALYFPNFQIERKVKKLLHLCSSRILQGLIFLNVFYSLQKLITKRMENLEKETLYLNHLHQVHHQKHHI
jgi:hypothetical protein